MPARSSCTPTRNSARCSSSLSRRIPVAATRQRPGAGNLPLLPECGTPVAQSRQAGGFQLGDQDGQAIAEPRGHPTTRAAGDRPVPSTHPKPPPAFPFRRCSRSPSLPRRPPRGLPPRTRRQVRQETLPAAAGTAGRGRNWPAQRGQAAQCGSSCRLMLNPWAFARCGYFLVSFPLARRWPDS
jgi:hypothetical protein